MLKESYHAHYPIHFALFFKICSRIVQSSEKLLVYVYPFGFSIQNCELRNGSGRRIMMINSFWCIHRLNFMGMFWKSSNETPYFSHDSDRELRVLELFLQNVHDDSEVNLRTIFLWNVTNKRFFYQSIVITLSHLYVFIQQL